jgi:hypothetical protein
MLAWLFMAQIGSAQQGPAPAQDKKPAAATEKETHVILGGSKLGGNPDLGSAMGGAMGQAVKPAKFAEPTLEEMLQKAMKDNPDIRVAEAKVREADAELNRTRLQVTQKVLAYHHSRESQKAIVKVAEDDLQRIQKLEASKAVSQEEVKQAQQRLSAAKAKLAEIEAEMPYLLGQQNRLASGSSGFSPDGKVLYSAFSDGTVRLWDTATGNAIISQYGLRSPTEAHWQTPILESGALTILHNNFPNSILAAGPVNLASGTTPNTATIREKVLKALETKISVDYKQKRVVDILEDLRKKVPGLSIHDLSGISGNEISLKIDGQVPLWTALEMLEDTVSVLSPMTGRVSFVLRDYGLLLAPSGSIPPGAIYLSNLEGVAIKNPEKEKVPAKDEKKASAEERKH